MRRRSMARTRLGHDANEPGQPDRTSESTAEMPVPVSGVSGRERQREKDSVDGSARGYRVSPCRCWWKGPLAAEVATRICRRPIPRSTITGANAVRRARLHRWKRSALLLQPAKRTLPIPWSGGGLVGVLLCVGFSGLLVGSGCRVSVVCGGVGGAVRRDCCGCGLGFGGSRISLRPGGSCVPGFRLVPACLPAWQRRLAMVNAGHPYGRCARFVRLVD